MFFFKEFPKGLNNSKFFRGEGIICGLKIIAFLTLTFLAIFCFLKWKNNFLKEDFKLISKQII